MDAATRDLLMVALNAAKMAGASFADARIARQRQNFVFTREQQIQNVVDTDSLGCGVRVLVDGTWGFGATRNMTRDAVAGAARQAVAIARANRVARDRAVEWLPVESFPNATWSSPCRIDPWTVSVEDKANILLQSNAAAMRAPNVRFVNSALFFVKEEKNYANTDGSVIAQTIVRSWPTFQATAVAADRSDFQIRDSAMAPMQKGWEFVLEQDMATKAERWGEEASQKLSAKPVDVGRYDLVLDSDNMWLTIHESIGHPTELDRAMGYEANYAGTSFVTLDKWKSKTFKYGSPFVNIFADKIQPNSLGAVGYDDEGVKTKKWYLIKDGILVDYQVIRDQAHIIGKTASDGCCYADAWSSVQFQRMPNVSLEPGKSPLSPAEMIKKVEKGIYIIGDGSFSIDQQRYNFQFGGDAFWEIKNGKKGAMLSRVAYQAKTTDFWQACDAIAGPAYWQQFGAPNDGKGEPVQINSVSHGCSPARFRGINVIVTD
jgi:TldD protein